MREAYRRSQEFLQTVEVERTSEEKLKEEFRKQLLLVAGFKQEEVEKMDVMSKSDEEFQGLVRERLLGKMANNGASQKVIDLDEVENHLAMGWEFVAPLSNGKAIMKIPS
jgi:FKBP-type peptidyl-prolyl cis-trans isomerase (trigger factor)